MKHLYIATALICIAPLSTIASEEISRETICTIFLNTANHLRSKNQHHEDYYRNEKDKINRNERYDDSVKAEKLQWNEHTRIENYEWSTGLVFDSPVPLETEESVILSIDDSKLKVQRSKDIIPEYTHLRMLKAPEAVGFEQGDRHQPSEAIVFYDIFNEMTAKQDLQKTKDDNELIENQLSQLITTIMPYFTRTNAFEIDLPEQCHIPDQKGFLINPNHA